MNPKDMAPAVAQPDIEVEVRTRLRKEYEDVRATTREIAAHLGAEDQMVQAFPEASPTKWHLAHSNWFYEAFVLREVSGYGEFDARFLRLFNSYYKSLGDHPDRRTRHSFSRPALREVMDYRAHVDQAVADLLAHPLPARRSELLRLGIHHEQQHQELMLTDIKAAFWTNPLRPSFRHTEEMPSFSGKKSGALQWVDFAGGTGRIGQDGAGFCFDNERPAHSVLLQPFQLADRLVTCGEFLDFIGDGGYRRPELWLSDGWDAVLAQQWAAPLYWSEQDSHTYSLFTLDGERPLAADEPVCHISFYEADAYARWAGARLPTEFEWEVAAQTEGVAGNLLDLWRLRPLPAGDGGRLRQMYGDVWEWTASPYVAYPGFQPAGGPVGEYNGKFMCNQMVLRGGSCATAASHIRATYRNFFPPHARWQFSGVRLAR